MSITNQYSTVLAAINAYRTQKTYPFCIQKSGSSAVTDLPSGFPTVCEWNVICIGNAQRTTALLTIYTGGSSKNGWTYKANIFNGEIIRDWYSLDEDLSNKVKAGTTEANVISFSTTVSFTSGVGYADASSVLPSGYRISIPVAAAVSTGSLAVTGCMKEESSNNRIRIQLSNASYSGDTAFNIIATIVRI